MFKTAAELREFLAWAKTQRIQQVKIGDIVITFSHAAMIEQPKQPAGSEPKEPATLGDYGDPLGEDVHHDIDLNRDDLPDDLKGIDPTAGQPPGKKRKVRRQPAT